jgi:hypothetical protein
LSLHDLFAARCRGLGTETDRVQSPEFNALIGVRDGLDTAVAGGSTVDRTGVPDRSAEHCPQPARAARFRATSPDPSAARRKAAGQCLLSPGVGSRLTRPEPLS